jgi:hypothetical protein
MGPDAAAGAQAAGIDAARLASYDRPIVSEPRFAAEQAPGLARDLTAYLATLRARRGPPRRAGALCPGPAPARPSCRPREEPCSPVLHFGATWRCGAGAPWSGRVAPGLGRRRPPVRPPAQKQSRAAAGRPAGTAAAGRPRAGGALGRGPAVGGGERAGLPPGARQGPRAAAGGGAGARRRNCAPARIAGRRTGAAGARAPRPAPPLPRLLARRAGAL